MFSSLFRKQLAALLGVLLIGFSVLAIVLNLLLQHFLTDRKELLLFREGEHLLEVLHETEAEASAGDRTEFNQMEAQLRKTLNIRVDLLLEDESTDSPKKRKDLQKLLKKSELSDPALLTRVLGGQRVIHTGPFTLADDERLLTVGLPVYVQDNGRIIGGLFLHTPVQEIEGTRITKLIMLTALCIAVPAAGFIYMMSRRMTAPLLRMNQGARRLGRGDFSVRVPVEGRDEVSQLADTFNSMAAQLEQLDRMRKELVTNVSHELRTPLTSVRGFVQGLRDGLVPEDQRERYLQIVHSELGRLTALLNTMLDLSAIEAGTVTLRRESIRWSALVETVMESVTPRMEEKGIRPQIQEPEQGILKAYGDPERLKQVLFNLLDNAIRHSEPGGSITVRSYPEGGWLVVEVSDTGTGIAPERLTRIWDRFYTEDASRHSHRERSGLGLTITKQLVELMEGAIRVESAPGAGTTFTITLPMPPRQLG